VAGRALRQEQHGVSGFDGVGGKDLVEELARVRKLRFEFSEHLFADGITAGRSAGADGGNEIAGPGAVVEAHAADAGFDNALDGSAPSGVECSDDALAAVGHQNRDAIGGLHSEEEAGLGGDLSVGAARSGAIRVGASGLEDEVRMKLAKGEERGLRVAGYGFGQQAAVGEDGGAVVARGEAEIQLAGRVFGAIGAGETALSGAESAPKPGKIPARNGQPFDSVCGMAGNGNGRREFFRSGTIETGRPGGAGLLTAWIADEACLTVERVKQFESGNSGRFGTG